MAWISTDSRLPPDTRDLVRVGFRKTNDSVADWGVCYGSVLHGCAKRGELDQRVVWWHSGDVQEGRA